MSFLQYAVDINILSFQSFCHSQVYIKTNSVSSLFFAASQPLRLFLRYSIGMIKKKNQCPVSFSGIDPLFLFTVRLIKER